MKRIFLALAVLLGFGGVAHADGLLAPCSGLFCQGPSTLTANTPILGNGAGQPTSGTRSGNTTVFATTNGTLTNTHCVSIDASGNLVDAGGTCTTGGGGGTVSSGTAGQMTYYASTGTTVSGNANATISAGALTLGQPTSVLGSIILSGSTSGTSTIVPNVAASGTLTLPVGTGTIYSTITGSITSAQLATSLTDETGSGLAVFATSPTLTTPTLGVATATTINKVTFTAPATGSTLTIADGKTLTASNSITIAGTDGSTLNVGTGGTLGTAAFVNTGTSGATIPLLNGANTWSGVQQFTDGDLSLKGATSGNTVVKASGTGGGTATFFSGTDTIAGKSVANGGTNCSSASITCFNNITGLSAAGTTGTTTTNLVFSTSPTLVTPTLGAALATSVNGTLIPTTAGDTTALLGTAETFTAAQTFTAQALFGGDTTARTFQSIGGNNLIPALQVGATTNGQLSATRWSAGAAGDGALILARSKSASFGTFTAVTAGDSLGEVDFSGTDGTNFFTGATIISKVVGTVGAGSVPADFEIWTTAAGGSNPTKGMTVNVDQTVTFTGTIPTISGTGTPTIRAGSTDTAGEVTSGTSATSVIITFSSTKANAPFCTVTPQTQLVAFSYTISTTAITITQTATTGEKIDYVCFQH